jgi:hypothetical protein
MKEKKVREKNKLRHTHTEIMRGREKKVNRENDGEREREK